MRTLECSYEPHIFRQAIKWANAKGRPLFIVVLATKPCYIKLASLVFALTKKDLPFLLIDTGQHYEFALTSAKQELGYEQLIGVHLDIRGDLIGRTADLATKLQWLAAELQSLGLRELPVPIVSGDTSTAAFLPPFWYLLTGCRSVHVEAGLRSLGPEITWEWRGIEHFLSQRDAHWRRFRDDPFPESFDTTLASVASDLLLAPVQRNADSLIREGYDPDKIHIVGSLSADAVNLALSSTGRNPAHAQPLPSSKYIRVDIHRRENMIAARLEAILKGVVRFSDIGVKVILVLTNALRSALAEHGMVNLLQEAERDHDVLIQELLPSYLDVIEFMRSPNCVAIFTDSGGLQEEASVLSVPCITCRYSTDRPETILDHPSNVLLPPENEDLIEHGLEQIISSNPQEIWPGLQAQHPYGERVGERISEHLNDYVPPRPARGAQYVFGLM